MKRQERRQHLHPMDFKLTNDSISVNLCARVCTTNRCRAATLCLVPPRSGKIPHHCSRRKNKQGRLPYNPRRPFLLFFIIDLFFTRQLASVRLDLLHSQHHSILRDFSSGYSTTSTYSSHRPLYYRLALFFSSSSSSSLPFSNTTN